MEVTRPRPRTWALAGAVWGLLSMVPVAAPHWYFNELLGSATAFRIGRALMWVMPSWYAVHLIAPGGWDSGAVPAWAFFGAVALASMALGATVALALWWLTDRARASRARASHVTPRC